MKKLTEKQKAILMIAGSSAFILGSIVYYTYILGCAHGSVIGSNAEKAKQALREVFKEA